MKKEPRTLMVLILIISVSLACKLAQPPATPTVIVPTLATATDTITPQTNTPAYATTTPLVDTLTPTASATTLSPTLTSTPTIDPLSAGDPYAPELGNSGYDVQAYNLQLTLDPATPVIIADVTITATSTTQIQDVSLDFIGFTIQTVTFLGQPADYHRQANKLLVDLPTTVPAGKEMVFEIAYSGEPVIEASAYIPFVSHIGMIRPDNQSLYVASEPDGSRYWFPCNDHPRDKATYRFELTVPEGMTGVAIGHLVSGPQTISHAFANGQDGELFTWAHNYPVATAFVTVAVANYQRIDGRSPKGIPLRSYVFPDQVDRFQSYEATIGEMIDWLGDLFGTYPFEAFGYVMVKNFGASLETQTMVVLDSSMLNEDTLVHEMAHMWFGDWVSLDSWGDIWRSEGFATYAQFLWADRNHPDQPDPKLQALVTYYANNPSGYPLDYPPRAEMFGNDSYMKGAALVQALRLKIGDQAFFDGLQAYFKQYGGGVASHAQFQAELEAASGQNLDDFFAQWFK